VHVSRHQRGHIGTHLRSETTGARQLQQLVDPIVEAGNLRQGLRRLAAGGGVAAVGDQFEADRDRRERRAQLVAGVRAELAFCGHQLGNALATVLQRLGDRVDLDEPAARRDDVGVAGADLHRNLRKPIERATELAGLDERRAAAAAATAAPSAAITFHA
jgi:hypothetical protein